MTKDMKLSELADELERLVSARNEPARLMRADHPQALQVAVATSNRIDRSLAEFVESNLPAILTALRDSTDRDAALSRLEAEKRELVGQIAQFVADWNGATADGNTFLIAEEIREKFGSKLTGDPS